MAEKKMVDVFSDVERETAMTANPAGFAVTELGAEDERIVTIENAAELQLRQEHVVRLESRPSNIEGKGEVTIRDLVINSLRMRPERIVVGECRGGEALDMLQALNTGHLGSLTTIHANNAEQALTRLAHCVLTANVGLPHRSTREAITLAIHLVVHLARLEGRRVVTEVACVVGYDLTSDRFVVEPWSPEGVVREGVTI